MALFRYRSPFFQVIILSVSYMLTVGMYECFIGLGAGGGQPTYATTSSTSTAINDSIWTVSCFCGGFWLALFGPRICLVLGSIGYPIFISGFWIYAETGLSWTTYLMSVFNGVLAANFFAALSWMITLYPDEAEKGKYIAVNAIIQAVGTSVMAAVCVGIDSQNMSSSMTQGLFIAFVCVTFLAVIVSFAIADPKTVTRDDGTHISTFNPVTPVQQLVNTAKAFRRPEVLLMAIPLFVSEAPLAAQSTYNAELFNARTRTLNNFGFWTIQIFVYFGFYLVGDAKIWSRRKRAFLLTGIWFVFMAASYIGGVVAMRTHETGPNWDWTDERWGAFFVLYLVWGCMYALNMAVRYWFVSSLTNDHDRLAQFSAIIATLQAAGITLAFGIASADVVLWKHWLVWLILSFLALPCYLTLASWYVKETNYGAMGEENVVIPAAFSEKLPQLVDGVGMSAVDKAQTSTKVLEE